MNRRHQAVTLLQASLNHPGLAKLMDRQRASSARLQSITPLIPASLRQLVLAGPMEEEGVWCLLLSNTTVAAKLRQLLPAFEAHLRSHDLAVTSIRLKIHRQD